ncbi:glycosyltransferase [Shimia ponticola]|uniref:glycosyltransferase n=1 Tax=Shimia ponticola TaxID=2582893 RepID=UPI001C9B28D0|nr:glycosyltransferase [Shimia ponticola]
MPHERVAILMATLNGAAFVDAQIRSLVSQTHTHWRLWVSDDGSVDDTLGIIRRTAGRKLARVIRGPGAGFAQNFLHLLRQVPAGHYVAFCDQDDIWHRDKLGRALTQLRGNQGPAMVCAATQPCDTALLPIGPPAYRDAPRLCFENALVQNQAPGNTIVLNPAAVAALKPASKAAWAVPAHDWWAYLCLSAMDAPLIWDPTPVVLYRQHAANAIGSNQGARARMRRIHRLLNGTYAGWISANLSALRPIHEQMPDRNRLLLERFCRSRRHPAHRRVQFAINPPVCLSNTHAQRAWQVAHALGCT